MKQKDIALIIIVVAVGGVLSFFVSNMLFGGEKNKIKAEIVQPISGTFPEMDQNYFNKDSFNPVKLITIGESDNDEPFSVQE